jgi:hypothetical protein
LKGDDPINFLEFKSYFDTYNEQKKQFQKLYPHDYQKILEKEKEAKEKFKNLVYTGFGK